MDNFAEELTQENVPGAKAHLLDLLSEKQDYTPMEHRAKLSIDRSIFVPTPIYSHELWVVTKNNKITSKCGRNEPPP